MSNLLVSSEFTQNGGEPVTGLTLSEINLYLTRQDKSTGVPEVIWSGVENPTVEVTNMGSYSRILTGADLSTYIYYGRAHYTGATLLDTIHVPGAIAEVEVEAVSVRTAVGLATANLDTQIGTLATTTELVSEVNDVQTDISNAVIAIVSAINGLENPALIDIAREILIRGIENIVDESTIEDNSLGQLILAAFESIRVGTNWTIYQSNHVTVLRNKTITLDPDANPVVGAT